MSGLIRTRIILLLPIIFIKFALSKQCDCEATESLSHPGCGVIPTTPTIINGEPASYPWMVFLYSFAATNHSFCGAFLISDLQMVTAAHCVSGKTIDEVVAVVGKDNVAAELRKLKYKILIKIEIFPVSSLISNNISDAFKHSSDVAVLTLEEPLILTSTINPICMSSLDDYDEGSLVGKIGTVAGWGQTNTGGTSMKQLMHVKAPIIANSECLKFYSWIKRYIFM